MELIDDIREDLRQPVGLLANTWHAPKVWYIARYAVVSARRHSANA